MAYEVEAIDDLAWPRGSPPHADPQGRRPRHAPQPANISRYWLSIFRMQLRPARTLSLTDWSSELPLVIILTTKASILLSEVWANLSEEKAI